MTQACARRAGRALAALILSAGLAMFLLYDPGQARHGSPQILAAAALR